LLEGGLEPNFVISCENLEFRSGSFGGSAEAILARHV